MAKPPFAFHAVPREWGEHFPEGDYTIGRGADPRSKEHRQHDAGQSPGSDGSSDQEEIKTDERRNRPASAAE